MENNSSKFKNLIDKGEQEELAFLPSFDLQQITPVVCSLLNRKGGKLVVGIDAGQKRVGTTGKTS